VINVDDDLFDAWVLWFIIYMSVSIALALLGFVEVTYYLSDFMLLVLVTAIYTKLERILKRIENKKKEE